MLKDSHPNWRWVEPSTRASADSAPTWNRAMMSRQSAANLQILGNTRDSLPRVPPQGAPVKRARIRMLCFSETRGTFLPQYRPQ